MWLSAALGARDARRADAPRATDSTPHDEPAAEPGARRSRKSSSTVADRRAAAAVELAPPYGEEVSEEERAERDALLAQAQARDDDLEQRWAADGATEAAAQTTQRIRALLNEHGIVAAQLECRTTLCRLDLTAGDVAAIAKLPDAAARLGTPHWVRAQPSSPQSLTVVFEIAAK
jgi:hypothetical protein